MFSRTIPSIPIIPGLEMKSTSVYENLCWYNYYVRHITPHLVHIGIFIRLNIKKILNRFAHMFFLNGLNFLEKFNKYCVCFKFRIGIDSLIQNYNLFPPSKMFACI